MRFQKAQKRLHLSQRREGNTYTNGSSEFLLNKKDLTGFVDGGERLRIIRASSNVLLTKKPQTNRLNTEVFGNN